MFLTRGFTRKNAFLTHLAISSAIFIVLLALIVFVWYPSFFLTMDGGAQGVATLFLVDMVLGPGLTLLLVRPGKRGVKIDVAIIIILQLAALFWGVSKVYEDRPAVTAFYLGKFNCIGIKHAGDVLPVISSGALNNQKLGFLQRPDTADEYLDQMKVAFRSGASEIYYYANKLVPISEQNIERVRSYQFNVDLFQLKHKKAAVMAGDYIKEHPGFLSNYGLYPLSCRFGKALAVFDFEKMRVTETIAITELDPLFRSESTIPMK